MLVGNIMEVGLLAQSVICPATQDTFYKDMPPNIVDLMENGSHLTLNLIAKEVIISC